MEYYSYRACSQFIYKGVCECYDVKQKTLEKGINEYFDVSPIALIKALKHNCFRKPLFYNMLFVSEAAEKCEITHLGQLSADYKKLFGERPSDTIKTLRLMTQNF